MSEMIERAAQAIYKSTWSWGGKSEMPSHGWDGIKGSLTGDRYRQFARAAIKAMREPTEAMLAAGTDTPGMRAVDACIMVAYVHGSTLGSDCALPNTPLQQAWRAMIDAALK